MENIVRDYDWTSSVKGSYLRQTAPAVWVKSYKIKSNQLLRFLKGYTEILSRKSGDEFYDDMYKSATFDEDFYFPYFGDDVRSFNNSFGDTMQGGVQGQSGIGSAAKTVLDNLMGVAGQAAGVLGADNINGVVSSVKDGNAAGVLTALGNMVSSGGDPGSYSETPMFYQFGKDDGSLGVTFVLSNTITPNAYKKNQKLVQKLTKINRPLRRDTIAIDPPRIYRVVIPGVRFIRWAYCDTFAVKLLGSRRLIGTNSLIPEGYQIVMSFKSLTIEHAGFVDKSNTF